MLFTGAAGRGQPALWTRIEQSTVPLGRLAYVNFGKQLRHRKQFPGDVITASSICGLHPPYRACYTGRDVRRYSLKWSKLACLNDESARRGGCWNASRQDSKMKILTRQIGRFPEFAIDQDGYQCLNTMFMINLRAEDPHALYLLGILNSTVVRAYWVDRFYDRRRTFPKIKGRYLERLPIPVFDFASPNEKYRHDCLVSLVQRMIDLHNQLDTARTPVDKTAIQRQIDATDRQIDQLVYELYELTDDEIKSVEGGRQ